MFCCQLQELIRWLYNVADITDSWVPPSPDAESLKASLHRCLVGIAAGVSSPFSAVGSKQREATLAGGGRKQLPRQPAAGVCLPKKNLLSNASLLLSFPGVQERCGRPPEPDGECAGEGRSSPRLHGVEFAR